MISICFNKVIPAAIGQKIGLTHELIPNLKELRVVLEYFELDVEVHLHPHRPRIGICLTPTHHL